MNKVTLTCNFCGHIFKLSADSKRFAHGNVTCPKCKESDVEIVK